MKITIETIPHRLQAYATVGNWGFRPRSGNLEISVSEMGDEDFEFLVGLHELVESWLCRKAGVTDEEVTAFDKAFEANRETGNTDEPGNEPNAPYRQMHKTATLVEMIVADAMGVDWSIYEKKVNSL